MSALHSISIKGFKSISYIENLPLGPINVLIGPNGSGKSNFIGVFSFLNAIHSKHLRHYVIQAGGADKVLHYGSKVTEELTIRISFDEKSYEYEIRLKATDADALYIDSEATQSEHLGYQSVRFFDITSRDEVELSLFPELTQVENDIKNHLNSWRLYHFHDTSSGSSMKKTADLNDNRFFRPDGANLAPFLYYLREKHESSYSLIRRTVQRAAPFFDDFALAPQQLNEDKIRLEWRHKGTDAYFDASSLSDGSLRFIALATLLLQPESLRPSVILLDEPELGLHPYVITMLASLLKQAAAQTQIILATQSPFLLDHFEPEDVLVADRVNGQTQLTRLDTPSLETWLQDYSLGQLWEKNEIGGRPSPEEATAIWQQNLAGKKGRGRDCVRAESKDC